MPIYVLKCANEACTEKREEILTLSAPLPDHCGKTMVKVPQAAGMAFVTAGGNLWNWTPAAGRVYQGGGRAKPKTVGKGHGVGGRRPNPSVRKAIQAGVPVKGKPLKEGA